MKTIENELPRKLILSQLYDKDKFSDLDDKTQKYSNEFYWNTLLKYKWFYGYYLILSKE